jgi:hypothetical protein
MCFPGCWLTRLGGYLHSILWMTAKIYAPESGAWVSYLLRPWKLPFSVTQAAVVIRLAPCLVQTVWLGDSCNQSLELETKRSQIRKWQWWWLTGVGWLDISRGIFFFFCFKYLSAKTQSCYFCMRFRQFLVLKILCSRLQNRSVLRASCKYDNHPAFPVTF